LRLTILFFLGSLVLPAAAHADEISDARLKQLVDRSDLIIVATTRTICGGCRGSGPYPDGIQPTPRYREFIFPVSVARILKGANAQSNPLWLSYTALRYESKNPTRIITTGHFSFDVGYNYNVHEQPLPGAPTPGVAYVFFLQNRSLRQPGSYEAAGGQEIIYENFDYTCGMIRADDSLPARIDRVATRN